MDKMDVLIYAQRKVEEEGQSLSELVNLVRRRTPMRIFISLEGNSEKVLHKLSGTFEDIPLKIVECEVTGKLIDKNQSTDLEVKRKVLELGLETLAKYVDNNTNSIESLNSEITISLFRAFFMFYSAAMPKDYEILYEDRRMCILGKLIHTGIENGDVLITSPWDAYWFIDELDKV
ncbi:MAG: hypothetical protein ACYCSO_01760 [Cuniculiplasma sp.]